VQAETSVYRIRQALVDVDMPTRSAGAEDH
jgi:hypothetical protein